MMCDPLTLREEQKSRTVVNTILDPEQFEAALNEKRAWLFLWVFWGCAQRSLPFVEELERQWHRQRADVPIPMYKVDVSEQSGPIWDALWTWMSNTSAPAGPLMYGGWGALIWLRSGSIADYEVNIAKVTARTRTQKTFMRRVRTFIFDSHPNELLKGVDALVYRTNVAFESDLT